MSRNVPSACGVLAIAAALWAGPAPADDLTLLEEQAFRAAVERAAPAVLRIETVGGLERVGGTLLAAGPTTGLVVSEDGYLLSSAANFVGQPTSILVTLPSGKQAVAQIVARDRSRMLVLLKVAADERLPVPEFVPRSEVRVGQWAIAIGRTFDGGGPNLSTGIVSATSRIWGKAIQTDAKISPANYGGPLVDIHGRVLGLLVPLSPQGQEELAGAEWYDSGIGFAIPLADVLPHLERMKQGEDLHPGILGVTLKPGNIYTDAAEIAACPANSPAAKAGLQKGDRIIEIDGKPIERQTQLRHVLGARYAGDTVQIAALRGDQRIEARVTLIDKLEPYQHPFLGVLPLRFPRPEAGVAVRWVYPGSPADRAGIRAGDRLLTLDGRPLADAGTLQEMVATLEGRRTPRIEWRRGEETLSAEIALAALPTDPPGPLPPAVAAAPEGDVPRDVVGVIEIKLPEEPNDCIALVPDDYHPAVPHGVVIFLHPPGGFDQERLRAAWTDLCAAHDLILLAPKAADPQRWERTEVDFIVKALDDLMGRYHVDRTRVVAFGQQGGASMAYLLGAGQRELIRGVVALDAALPAGVEPEASDPIYRQAYYITTAKGSAIRAAVDATINRLRGQQIPVTVKDLGDVSRPLTDEELAELARWIDALDRI